MACMGFDVELELLVESVQALVLPVLEGGGGGGIWLPMETPICCSAWVMACMKSLPSPFFRAAVPCTWLASPELLLALLMELMKFVNIELLPMAEMLMTLSWKVEF